MVTARSRRRIRFTTLHPFAAFLLVACFGLLFGCKGPGDTAEEFVFTEEDIARYRELARDAEDRVRGTGPDLVHTETGALAIPVGEGEGTPFLEGLAGTGSRTPVGEVALLDLTLVPAYNDIRTGMAGVPGNVHRVTNAFLNLRSKPSSGAPAVDRLVRGDLVDVQAFVNALWAKVKSVTGGKEGYVAIQYIARVTSEDKLAEEKKKYDGQYYVNFTFVNVRRTADQKSAKLGEIPGQTIVKPIGIQGAWAKVPFGGKEGYVAMKYLSPFTPRFLVRQERYELPVLQYRLGQMGVTDAIVQHVGRLKQEGYAIWTLRAFHDFLLRQEQQDIELPQKTVLLAIVGVTPATVREASDALTAVGIPATLFIETRHLGLSGITEKMLLTLSANGFDLQSAGHTGDDLRALTNAQAELELKQSRQLLEGLTKKRVMAISYPQGGTNDRVMQLAMQAGYLLGVVGAPERRFTRDQLLRLPSFVIFPSMSADEVLKTVRGS